MISVNYNKEYILMSIHPTAQIHKTAKVSPTAIIKAYVIIGRNVEIGDNTVLESHAVIQKNTKMGKNNHVYSFAVVGGDPQDISYEDEQDSRLVMGDDNQVREFCTINRGTIKQDGVTIIGSNNLFMAYTHIAHDCRIGDNVVLTNNTTLAGHVEVGDWVVMGGFTLVKQFTRIGEHAYTGMGSQLNKDVPPFLIVSETPAKIRCVNSEGMRRRGIPKSSVNSIKNAFRTVYGKKCGTVSEALEGIECGEIGFEGDEVKIFLDFFKNSKNGILR